MRKVININSGWEFVREGLTENVDLPHTWNGIDGQLLQGQVRLQKDVARVRG